MIESFLDPAGPIAEEQLWHLIKVTALTMVAVLPVFVLVPFLLWRYRYQAKRPDYDPEWERSPGLEILIWGVPFAIIGVLSFMLWRSTVALDPYKPISGTEKPIKVQVIGLDWKWLFIYPDLKIASVGELVFPADQPVELTLTTDTVMQSFMISALAGQIYAMPGMTTKLNLLAKGTGTFQGENTQYNGTGFHAQKFRALSMEGATFHAWVASVSAKGRLLDEPTYGKLAERATAKQSKAALGLSGAPDGALYFTLPEADIFQTVLARYRSGQPMMAHEQPGSPTYRPSGTGQ